MGTNKLKGKNYSIYFPQPQSEFINQYIDNLSAYLQGKVEEDMAECEVFFNKNIHCLEQQLNRQKELLKKARENKKKKDKNLTDLKNQYLARKDPKTRDSFLDGATGKKLLLDAQMTKQDFKEKILDLI